MKQLTEISRRSAGATLQQMAGTIVLLSACCSAWAGTVVFQSGDSGYNGAIDTYLSEANPTTLYGSFLAVEWDGDEPSGSANHNIALLRFDNLFGTNGGQVPPGAQITSATLSYTVINAGGDGQLHTLLVDWDELVTYDTFGGNSTPGVQANEMGPTLAAAPGGLGARDVRVTASIAAWASGAEVNRGWVILPTATDGVQFRSREYRVAAQRPKLTVVFDEGPPVPALLREPYLQSGSSESVVVAWRTDVTTSGLVAVGNAPDALNHVYLDMHATRDHAVTVTGLQPATKYYYAIGTDTHVLAGGDNAHTFVTSPATGVPAAFTAWLVGDSGTGDSNQASVRDAMLAYTAAAPPDIFIHVGDMAYEDGTDDQFTNNFFAPYENILRHTVVWPTLGNHEGHSADSATASGPYYESYVLPKTGQAGGLPSGTEAYYAFDYANVHFICLDSHDTDKTPGSPMLTWLQADLASTDQPWIIGFWHHPPYTRGNHNSDDVTDSEGSMVAMRQNVLPILEAGGVDLVLTGHSHNYERSYLVNGAYDTPTTAAGHIVDAGDGRPAGTGPYLKAANNVANAGAVYIVAGHGGTTNSGPGGHPLIYARDLIHGSCLLHFERNAVHVENLRRTGAVSDSFAIVKGAHTGDCNIDGLVTTGDFEAFTACISGPAVPFGALGCMCADMNEDDVVDLRDYAVLQLMVTP